MCPGTAEKPDANIHVGVSTPSGGATINSQFTLSYSVDGPKNIRRVLVLLNKQQIGVFEYPAGNTKTVSDTKQITITGTGFRNNEYTLEVIAFDFAGFSNKATLPVNLVLGDTPAAPSATDTAAPTINTSGIRISKNADATYTVILPLQDATGIVS